MVQVDHTISYRILDIPWNMEKKKRGHGEDQEKGKTHFDAFAMLSLNIYEQNISQTCFELKGAWHENFEKLILLKLADMVSLHLNIPSTIKKLQTCISFRRGENFAYVIYCFI